MKVALVFMMLGLSGSVHAQTSDCGLMKEVNLFAACLNTRANQLLTQASLPDSEISQNIKSMRDLHKLQGEALPLNKAFKLSVLTRGEIEFSDGQSCFPGFQPGQVARNQALAENFLKQTGNLIDFLGSYHASQYGRSSSFLFQIKDVRVCDISKTDDRRLIFTNGILRFGYSQAETVNGRDLVDKWRSGDQLRMFDKGYFDRLGGLLSEDRSFYFFTRREKRMFSHPRGGVRGVIWDRIVDNLWIALDPTGRERVTASGLLQGELTRVVQRMKEGSRDLTSAEIYQRLRQVALSGPGFSTKHLEYLQSLQNDPVALERIHSALIESMGDLAQMYRLIENASLHAPSGSKGAGTSTLIDIRNIHGEVNISNQHNISVAAMSAPAMLPWNEFFKQPAEACGSNAMKKIQLKTTTGAANPIKAREGQAAVTSELTIETTACDDVTLLASTVASGFDQNGNLKGAKVAVSTSDTVDVQTDFLGKISDIVGRMNSTMLKRASLYRILNEEMNEGTSSSAQTRKP